MTFLDETMGFLLIGVIISGVLYGVSCSQVYYYFTRCSSDAWPLKLLVMAVWTTDTVHQALISHSIYWYMVSQYGNPLAVTYLTKSIVIEVLFNGFTGLFVQCFFVARIYKLSSKKLYFVIPVLLLVLAEFALSVAYTFRSYSFLTFEELHKIRAISVCMNVFAAAADVSIAAILCSILHLSRTNFSKSNTLINKLIIFAVNTGLLTSICACISLITFFALPNSFVYICFYLLIGRLYSNSLMATLNARKSLRDSSKNDVSLSLRDMQPGATTANLAQYSVTRRGDGIAIRIDTTKESKRDGDTGTDVELDVDVDVDGDGDGDLNSTRKTPHRDFRLSQDWISPRNSMLQPSPRSPKSPTSDRWSSLEPPSPV